MIKTTIEINGMRYYIINKKIVDEHYLVPPKDELIAIYNDIIKYRDDLTNEQLYDFAIGAKENGCYNSALEIVMELQSVAMKNSDFSQIRKLTPIITSLFRSLSDSQQAIDYYETMRTKFGDFILSAALLTSIAAAHCDLRDYTTAKKFADRAYAKGGWSIELTSVYSRIKNEA